MSIKIPESLEEEHKELHDELMRVITQVRGDTGKAAKKVGEIMHPHFVKEEEYAMPPLGLLAPLARGESIQDIDDILQITERLKIELPQMLAEHRAIVDALLKLADVAAREDRMEVSFFAKKLIRHVQTEEEVLYPASILVGEYLKMIVKRS